MKRQAFISIIAVATCLIAFTFYLIVIKDADHLADDPGRSEAFERHAAASELAREEFDKLYKEHLHNNCTPAILADKLGLANTLQRESRSDGGYEVRIELPDSYSRLIFMWASDGSNNGYAWEIVSPAANNVSWAEHMAHKQ